jgi:hypothetical protein
MEADTRGGCETRTRLRKLLSSMLKLRHSSLALRRGAILPPQHHDIVDTSQFRTYLLEVKGYKLHS